LSLVQSIQRLIERTYRIPPVIPDIAPYIIGDRGLQALDALQAGIAQGRASTLVRDRAGTVRAAVYYPDALIHHLERHDPARGLGDVNIEAFAVLVEEIDHLLLLAHRASERRQVSRMELEHHAFVTRYLVVLHFLGKQLRRRRIPEALRIWVRHHLFGRHEEGTGEEGERYRSAARAARRYVDWIDRLSTPKRRAELIAFQRRPFADTDRLLAQVSLS
jgi:hypothetical protein